MESRQTATILRNIRYINHFETFSIVLTIYIKVKNTYIVVYIESYCFQIEEDGNGLQTSTLGLRFKVKDKHFRNSGDLKLKCTATIATIYWKSNEESVQGVRTQSALVSESRSSRNSGKK